MHMAMEKKTCCVLIKHYSQVFNFWNALIPTSVTGCFLKLAFASPLWMKCTLSEV